MTNKTPWTAAIRRNWGYWEGVAARTRNQFPMWNKVSVYRCQHPSDKPYGEAFWAGWYGEEHPCFPSIYPGSTDFMAGGLSRLPKGE